MIARVLSTFGALGALARYEASIVPRARREIGRWAQAAARIPDRDLRALATSAIVDDAGNAEAAAAFAVFAPRRHSQATVALLVASQILFDYVDALGECEHDDPLGRGFALGRALAASLGGAVDPADVREVAGDDGGYLATLVAGCRTPLSSFPAFEAVHAPLIAAGARCGEALARTHASARAGSVKELSGWATAHAHSTPYEWWEIAAGGNANLDLLALLAAASDSATSALDARAIADAYWPHVCTLSTLLDSLVDHERDGESGNFSFVGRYADTGDAERSIVAAATRSLEATRALPRSHLHTMIVCGVAGFYAAEARPGSLADQVAPAILAALRPTSTPIVAALRVQRRLKPGAWRGSPAG